MSWLKRIFGGTSTPKASPAPRPKRTTSLEEIRAELEANRRTLDKATAASPKRRVKRPVSGPLWEPVYAAMGKPTELIRAEAVCFLVGATALYYKGDGLDNGLLGNFGEEELASALPALRLIGAGPVADVLRRLLGELRALQELPTDQYFKKLGAYDTALAEADIGDLLTKLDRYLAANYRWALVSRRVRGLTPRRPRCVRSRTLPPP